MTKFKEDKFITKLIGYKSYIVHKKILSKSFKYLKKPFFLTIKSKKRISFKSKVKGIKINLPSKLIYFERRFKKKVFLDLPCRGAKKKDINKIINIAKENNLDSRFMVDELIPSKFKKKYRSQWVRNFFNKKRGDYLFVSYQNNEIMGFILIIKKKKILNIDLIATSKKYRKKGIATSLINYTNNKLMKKSNRIIAGTQLNNFSAIKMYQKLGFIRKKETTFCYHIHGR
tara:strand:- start:1267 stop:1953 length:687 start_codon:yes stop_codon:yes gene_type:complete